MFRNVAFLEISTTPLLTRVAGLQYTFCNATKYELLTKEGLSGRPTSVLKKDFFMDVYFIRNFKRQKLIIQNAK